MNVNILVVGIGGQGVMTAAEVLARSALAAGWDACKTEIAGMSQRGGVVSSHVRIASHVHASEIMPGQVDLLLAMEMAEGLRWGHWLAPAGRAIVSTLRAVPPVVSSGRATYPEDPFGDLLALGHEAWMVNAAGIAATIGDARAANSVLLGAASDFLPLASDDMRGQLLLRFRGNDMLTRSNKEAYEAGRAWMRAARPGRAGLLATGDVNADAAPFGARERCG